MGKRPEPLFLCPRERAAFIARGGRAAGKEKTRAFRHGCVSLFDLRGPQQPKAQNSA